MRKFVTAVRKASGLEIDDECYEVALQEFTDQNLEISTLARSISEACGDDEKVRSLYIKIRAKRIQFSKEGKETPKDDCFYAQAFNELEQNKPNQAIFSRSVADANGNDNRLKSLYIKNRVKRLKDEAHERISKEREKELETFNVFLKKHPSGYELPMALKWSLFKKTNAGEDVTDEIKQAADDLNIRRRESRIFILSLVMLGLGALCANLYISNPYELPPLHQKIEAPEDRGISINGESFSFTCPAGFTMVSDRTEMKDVFPLLDQDYRHVTHQVIYEGLGNNELAVIGRLMTPSKSIGARINPRAKFIKEMVDFSFNTETERKFNDAIYDAKNILEDSSLGLSKIEYETNFTNPSIISYDQYGFYSASIISGDRKSGSFKTAFLSAATVVKETVFILSLSQDYKGPESHGELLKYSKEILKSFVTENESQ